MGEKSKRTAFRHPEMALRPVRFHNTEIDSIFKTREIQFNAIHHTSRLTGRNPPLASREPQRPLFSMKCSIIDSYRNPKQKSPCKCFCKGSRFFNDGVMIRCEFLGAHRNTLNTQYSILNTQYSHCTCRGGRIRTCDLLLPKQARCRATLHPVKIRTCFEGAKVMLHRDTTK